MREDVVQEGGLAHTRLAANDQGTTRARARVREEPIKPLALGSPASQLCF
jgi:hypothetical protein